MLDTALRYFLEVVRCGSIAEASQRLHVAPSAISRQIAKLEADLGAVLFDRHPRGMVPSPAGTILAGFARTSVLDAERAMADIRGLRTLDSGLVRLASIEGTSIDLMPAAITSFRKAYAGIRFDLRVVSPAQVTRHVRDGDVDLGLTFSLAPEKAIQVEYALRAPVMALVKAGHPLAGRASVALADLRDHPLALPAEDTTIRQLLDIACAMERIILEPVVVCNYIAALNNLVRDGGVMALSGRLSVAQRLETDGLVLVPIDSPRMQERRLEVQTLAGRTLPHAVCAFRDHLVTMIRGLVRPDEPL